MMFLTRSICAVLVILAAALSSPSKQPQSAEQRLNGRLTGVVLDSDGSAVSNAQVVIDRVGFQLVVTTGSDGNFETEIPIGIYKVIAIRDTTQVSQESYALVRASTATKVKLTLKKITLAEAIRESHINANVPDEKDFDVFLKRDLNEYFKDVGKSVNVDYELLRKAPTQAGVAFPKFYVWVVIKLEGQVVEEGAARVAAVEKKEFEVVNYLPRAEIEKDMLRLDKLFPTEVADKIREKVNISRRPPDE